MQACPMEYLHLCRISGERRATGRKEQDRSEEKNQKCYCVGQDFLFNLDLVNNEKNTYIQYCRVKMKTSAVLMVQVITMRNMFIFAIGICRNYRELIKTGKREGDDSQQESSSIQERFQEITLVCFAVPSYNWGCCTKISRMGKLDVISKFTPLL